MVNNGGGLPKEACPLFIFARGGTKAAQKNIEASWPISHVVLFKKLSYDMIWITKIRWEIGFLLEKR